MWFEFIFDCFFQAYNTSKRHKSYIKPKVFYKNCDDKHLFNLTIKNKEGYFNKILNIFDEWE